MSTAPFLCPPCASQAELSKANAAYPAASSLHAFAGDGPSPKAASALIGSPKPFRAAPAQSPSGPVTASNKVSAALRALREMDGKLDIASATGAEFADLSETSALAEAVAVVSAPPSVAASNAPSGAATPRSVRSPGSPTGDHLAMRARLEHLEGLLIRAEEAEEQAMEKVIQANKLAQESILRAQDAEARAAALEAAATTGGGGGGGGLAGYMRVRFGYFCVPRFRAIAPALRLPLPASPSPSPRRASLRMAYARLRRLLCTRSASRGAPLTSRCVSLTLRLGSPPPTRPSARPSAPRARRRRLWGWRVAS